MSDFEDMMAEGFEAVLDVTRSRDTNRAPMLIVGDQSCECVTTPLARSKEMRDSGYWPKFHLVAEILRTDLRRLGIKDRSIVNFQDGEGAMAPVPLLAIGIEDDPADACVKVTLKEHAAP